MYEKNRQQNALQSAGEVACMHARNHNAQFQRWNYFDAVSQMASECVWKEIESEW